MASFQYVDLKIFLRPFLENTPFTGTFSPDLSSVVSLPNLARHFQRLSGHCPSHPNFGNMVLGGGRGERQ